MRSRDELLIELQAFRPAIPVPPSVARDVDAICQVIGGIFSGRPADLSLFPDSMARLAMWARTRGLLEPGGLGSAWRAGYFGLAGLGGTLVCQDGRQELMLSLNSAGTPYLGSWRSTLPGDENRGGSFRVDSSLLGAQLILNNGLRQQPYSLPASMEGWGRPEDFFSAVNSVQEPPPAEMAFQPHLPPSSMGQPPGQPPQSHQPVGQPQGPAQAHQPVGQPQPSPAQAHQPVGQPQPSPAQAHQPIGQPQPSPAQAHQPIGQPQPSPAQAHQPIGQPQPSPAQAHQPIGQPSASPGQSHLPPSSTAQPAGPAPSAGPGQSHLPPSATAQPVAQPPAPSAGPGQSHLPPSATAQPVAQPPAPSAGPGQSHLPPSATAQPVPAAPAGQAHLPPSATPPASAPPSAIPAGTPQAHLPPASPLAGPTPSTPPPAAVQAHLPPAAAAGPSAGPTPSTPPPAFQPVVEGHVMPSSLPIGQPPLPPVIPPILPLSMGSAAAPLPGSISCRNCGSLVDPGKKFCGNCGAPIAPTVCSNCGSALKPGAKFCETCGNLVAPRLKTTGDLSSTQVEPPAPPPPAPSPQPAPPQPVYTASVAPTQQPAQSLGLCTNCHAPLKPGKKFCGTCGAPVTVQPAPTELVGPPPAQRMTWFLMITTGSQQGMSYPVTERMTIGRSLDNMLVINDTMVSGHHALIERSGNGFIITDTGSRNGTFVDQEPISQPTGLFLGSQIRIGQTVIIIQG